MAYGYGSTMSADWCEISYVDDIESTNSELRQRAIDGAAHGTVLVADHQTSGRGRLGRVWTAPPGTALLFSVVLRPQNVDSTRWGWLPLTVALAVNDALHGWGVQSNVKWPNDVLVDGAKLAGILTERVDTTQGVAVITGVGLNVDMARDQLPTPNATSLQLLNASIDRDGLLLELLSKLQDRYAQWSDARWNQLSESYLTASSTIGRDVQVEVPAGERVSGIATGVDDLGRLIVATSTEPVHLSAGDVTHLRLAE